MSKLYSKVIYQHALSPVFAKVIFQKASHVQTGFKGYQSAGVGPDLSPNCLQRLSDQTGCSSGVLSTGLKVINRQGIRDAMCRQRVSYD